MEVASRSGSTDSGEPGVAGSTGHAVDQELSSSRVRRDRSGLRGRIGAYVALTKPRIIELLLITTIPALFAAQREVPPLTLVLATLVGGALAAVAFRFLNPDDVTGPIVPAGIPGVTAKQTVPTSRRRSS